MSADPYRDPVLYDLEYAGHVQDIEWYRSLLQRLGGPVLELGVGSGRIALPLLADGHDVVGVDLSQPMLDALQRRLDAEPDLGGSCELHCADFRELDLERRFPTILLPFNAIHHCTGDADLLRLLAVVRRHLGPRGVFALDCYLPDPALYARDPNERYEPRTFVRPDTGEKLVSWEQSWYDELTAVHHVRYTYESPDGAEHAVQLDLRMWTHEELHALLARAGFTVLHEMADFTGTAMTEDALQSVLVLTA